MRKVWLLASAVLAFLNFVKSQEVARTLYSTRYDNLDIDTILGSNRLVSNYVDCLLSRKPCPPEGKDLKRILPEALRTKCARCSPIQKENALKIITRLYYDYPDQYRALRERWDPSGEYHRRFEEYLRGLQFNQIGGNGGTIGGTVVGNTIENGGNDRPVRNDLDRQPATQSSNVQPIVINPTLAAQGNVNTLVPIPSSPTPLQPSAVAPATERPRPPAPVAQILFPTTTDTSDTSTTITTTTSTTTSTSTFNSGPLELTSNAPSASVPSNTVTSSSASILSPSGGTVASFSPLSRLGVDMPDSTATAVVPVPIPQGFLLPRPTITVSNVAQSLQQHGTTTTTTPFGTVRLEEVSTVPLWLEAQLAQQIPPERPQGSFVDFVPTVTRSSSATFNARPVVDGVGNQNVGTTAGTTAGQLPFQASMYDGPTTTGRALATMDNGFDKLPTAPPPVVVNRFGDDDANGRPSIAPVPAVPVVTTTTTTTTQRPTTTTVRQTRPVTRQTTTRNTQRTSTRFITRVPQTTPPTRLPTIFTTTRTSTTLQQRPPQPYPAQQQPILPAQQQPILPPQTYPTIVYERPQAPPRASPPPPPPQALPPTAPARPIYVPQAPPRASPPPPQALPPTAPARPIYVPQEPPRTPPTQYGVPTTPDSIIDHFFVPPSQGANPPLQPSPIVGLWNQLGTKIADTADAIAGMLQKTVDVLVTSHIQSHQRALRRI